MHRRQFLATSSSCSAHMLGMALFAPAMFQKVMKVQEKDRDNIVAEEKFARLEKIEEGVYAMVSTPSFKEGKHFTTVCNGGIIAGDDGVLAIESFMRPEGARWLAEQAQKLVGKWPTNIVSTHHHGDHSSGHRGYFSDKFNPKMWLTESTRDAAQKSFVARHKQMSRRVKEEDRKPYDNDFKNVNLIDPEKGATIDLGNRKVNLVPRSGHTASDITIELQEPRVVWTGDLFFNRMYPNYSDATPTQLNNYVGTMMSTEDATFVPGHGPVAGNEEVEKYKTFLAHVEKEAKSAFDAGMSVAEASKDYKLPKELNEWMIWSSTNGARAFNAWFRELEAMKKEGSMSKSKKDAASASKSKK